MIEYEDLTEKQRLKYDDIMSKLPERPYDENERFIGKLVTDIIEGFAGSGKTTLVALIIRDLKRRGYKVFCCAPTHNAVSEMKKAYSGEGLPTLDFVGTIHSAIGLKMETNEQEKELKNTGVPKTSKSTQWSKNKTYLCDIIFCDEASMDSPAMVKYIEIAQAEDMFHVIYIGDSYQLEPVDGDEPSPVFELPDEHKLDKITRQAEGSPIIAFSAACRDKIDYFEERTSVNTPMSFNAWDNGNEIQKITVAEIVDKYISLIENNPENAQYHRILSFTNTRVNSFNRIVRKKLCGDDAPEYTQGELVVLQEGVTVEGAPLFYNNETIRIKEIQEVENVEEAPLRMNGTLVEKHTEFELKSYEILAESLDGERTGRINLLTSANREELEKWLSKLARHYRKVKKDGNYKGAKLGWDAWWELKSKYPMVNYAFASTVHKAQGTTVDNVIFDLASTMGYLKTIPSTAWRLIYVAATRPRKTFYFAL